MKFFKAFQDEGGLDVVTVFLVATGMMTMMIIIFRILYQITSVEDGIICLTCIGFSVLVYVLMLVIVILQIRKIILRIKHRHS
jgi:hypothetical protein